MQSTNAFKYLSISAICDNAVYALEEYQPNKTLDDTCKEYLRKAVEYMDRSEAQQKDISGIKLLPIGSHRNYIDYQLALCALVRTWHDLSPGTEDLNKAFSRITNNLNDILSGAIPDPHEIRKLTTFFSKISDICSEKISVPLEQRRTAL